MILKGHIKNQEKKMRSGAIESGKLNQVHDKWIMDPCTGLQV